MFSAVARFHLTAERRFESSWLEQVGIFPPGHHFPGSIFWVIWISAKALFMGLGLPPFSFVLSTVLDILYKRSPKCFVLLKRNLICRIAIFSKMTSPDVLPPVSFPSIHHWPNTKNANLWSCSFGSSSWMMRTANDHSFLAAHPVGNGGKGTVY